MKRLMTHIVAGYPTLGQSERIAKLMIDKGVAFLEVQIPFSDPVADGKTIMRANQVALENGIKVSDSFALMKRLKTYADLKSRTYEKIPGDFLENELTGGTFKEGTKLLFMTYFNIVFNYGVEKFCKKAAASGCYGLIVPDMPIDEEKNDKFLYYCDKYGLAAIQVVSPITPESRLKKIAKVARGFVYCVSHTGTTGSSGNKISGDLKKYVLRVRKHIDLPIAVGFGISSGKQIKEVLKLADIAVVGSKLIETYSKGGIKAVGEFLGE